VFSRRGDTRCAAIAVEAAGGLWNVASAGEADEGEYWPGNFVLGGFILVLCRGVACPAKHALVKTASASPVCKNSISIHLRESPQPNEKRLLAILARTLWLLAMHLVEHGLHAFLEGFVF
jgi:hypothetical protein